MGSADEFVFPEGYMKEFKAQCEKLCDKWIAEGTLIVPAEDGKLIEQSMWTDAVTQGAMPMLVWDSIANLPMKESKPVEKSMSQIGRKLDI